jgi:tRNA1(Val) A37 N6-methylase TrmN6
MCDLCSGTGIIPLLLCDANDSIICDAIEINSDACEISKMSAEYSGYSDRFCVNNIDIKDVKQHYESEQFDFLTCNPPYMTANSGKMCDDDYKTIARHEVLCNINDVFAAAFYLLRTGGSIFIVYRADRLSSLFKAAHNNRFEIKRMTAVVTKELPSVIKLVLCEAKKDGNEGLVLESFKIN